VTDAEKVVKALREMQCECVGCYKDDDWVREHDGECKAMHALADFVEAAKATRDDVPACDCPPEGHYGMCDRQQAFDAALARLAEVLNG
jgi:hypothetical protein